MVRRMEMSGGGWLSVMEDGGLVRLEARREEDGQGLYKVWLQGEGTGRMLLGTLAPEGDGLRLCRRLTRQSMACSGCWPLVGAKCVLAYRFRCDWMFGPYPAIGDRLIREKLAGKQGLVLRETEGGFRLAFPLDPQRPFPLPALFCLGWTEYVQGQLCVVFAFDEQGRPYCAEKHCCTG